MWSLPQTQALGPLEMVEVYEYFDQPCLFACRNATGQIYLAVLMDTGTTTDTWWYVAVSAARFNALRSGQVQLRDAFLLAESGQVGQLVWPHAVEASPAVSWISVGELAAERLPAEGEALSVAAAPAHGVELRELARALRKEAISLWLEIRELASGLAPAAPLGQLLIAFQSLMDAVGQANAGRPTTKGVVPQEIRSNTLLHLHAPAFAAGSFGVTLVSAETARLVDETVAGDALEVVFELLAHQADEEKVSTQLRGLHRRVTANYELFLASLVKAGADCSLSWASPKPERDRAVHFTAEAARQTAEVVRRIESSIDRIEVRGTLVGFHERLGTFELLDDDDQRYEGKVAAEAVPAGTVVTIGQRYAATIIEEIEVELASGSTKSRHMLAELASED